MISHPVPACSCCGAPTPDDKRIDVRFGLPDAVFGGDEQARRHPEGLQALLQADGHGSFVRCLLPVRLTDGIELVIGTWLRITDADLARAAEAWETPAYRDLVFEGTLANATRPWQDRRLDSRVTATVLNEGEIPYVTAAKSTAVSEVLTDEWNRDYVLSRFGHALPVPVRTRVDGRWSIERTPGLQGRVVDGSHRFYGPGRTVFLDALTRREPDADLEAQLAALLQGAPSVPAEQQLTEREPGCLRHAFWTTTVREGKEQHTLYGFVVVPGAALVTGCVFDETADLAWARHVWRSIRVEDGEETTR
ncbi:DUF2199 domain-containing protein [Streptacidiphilus melanogenes]|uniref:DUF2199 domain-containing protein n=1 Tax=Streptacidiphilus melanogenes TaxID=411235 RepID=UPI001364CB68|nr:DUF2199 domain-containing protein [Streptacidiphilus melanogenes]